MSFRVICVTLALLAGIALLGGCGHHGRASSSASPSVAVSGADLNRGRAVFERECSACHGSKGVGGAIGPSLANERARRSFEAVRAIVMDPQPPMPKLYPARMTEPEVRDVSAYVESL